MSLAGIGSNLLESLARLFRSSKYHLWEDVMKKLLACVAAAVAMTFTISASSMAAPIEI